MEAISSPLIVASTVPMAEEFVFKTVDQCSSQGREGHTVVVGMDGTILRGRSSFPYFAHMAFDTGGPVGVLRLLFLLLLAPLASLLYCLVSQSASIQVLIFASMSGVRVDDIESVARAVLPKFYSSDLHPESWRVFSACGGRRCVVTVYPRVMVEAFLKDYLGADLVLGTEVGVWGGRYTGLVRRPGMLVGEKKAHVLRETFGDVAPDVGLGNGKTDFPFLRMCQEGYVVPAQPAVMAVRREELPKPIVFHDGRLVQKPTPLLALLIMLWIPVAFLLACLRIAASKFLPMRMVYHALWALGVKVYIRGTPPPRASSANQQNGILFVCSHRTLLDPIFLSIALGRRITVVTYSVSRLSEILSPIPAVRLTRDRKQDAAMMKEILKEGDLVICPEGTTCREPFLLRFSALFAELTDEIVPVGMANRMSMFHGTTARGWKGLDAFYFLMNPSPEYEITFLSKLPSEFTCNGGGMSSHDVANYIQRLIAGCLSYECTSLTRRDKYLVLTGNDGTVR